MEVIHMTKQRSGRRGILKPIGLVLLVTALLALGLASAGVGYAQQESADKRYIRLLARMPKEALLQLPAAMASLSDEGAAGLTAFLKDPRDYLEAKGIALRVNYFQVVGLHFEDQPDPAKAWFGVAEQQEDLTFVAAGIGFFYENVGIFIQPAVVPPAGASSAVVPPFLTTGTEATQAIESYLQLIERIPPEALVALPAAMEELSGAPEEDPRRAEFLKNPRDYLLKKDILLPSAYYRVVALDFQRAARLPNPVVVASKTRGGLAVVPEGIGLFFQNLGIFIQEAI
jgi:hypothetical protein